MSKLLQKEVILHDAVISGCKIKNQNFIIDFAGGFMLNDRSIHGQEIWTDSGRVIFEKIDFESSQFTVFYKNKHKTYTLNEFKRLVNNKKLNRIEIIEEFYGFSSALYSGYLFQKENHRSFQLKLYMFGDIIYKYKGGNSCEFK